MVELDDSVNQGISSDQSLAAPAQAIACDVPLHAGGCATGPRGRECAAVLSNDAQKESVAEMATGLAGWRNNGAKRGDLDNKYKVSNHANTATLGSMPGHGDGGNTIPAQLFVCDAPLPAVGHCDGPLDRKRKTVWHNEPRNNLVAALATGFADRQIELLWGCGLLLDQETLAWPAPWPTWTAVLVESPEHGRQLQALLPAWRLVHAVGGSAALDAPQLGLQAAHRTIITLVAASEMTSFSPDVLIVPMGGDWAFDLPNLANPAPGREAADRGRG